MDLAICIGCADVIEIDKRERADAGAGEGFDGPTSDPPNPNNGNMRFSDALESFVRVQALDSAESRILSFRE